MVGNEIFCDMNTLSVQLDFIKKNKRFVFGSGQHSGITGRAATSQRAGP